MATDDFVPWIKYPDLTEARLQILAEEIRSVRHTAILAHEPHRGDGDWGLGCRAYERTCFAIREASKRHSWLRINPEQKLLQFSFSVGSIPIRFYKGEPDDPPSHYLGHTYGELRHIQFSLDLGNRPPVDRVLRLAVETGVDREVSAITLVECNEASEIENTFSIPFEARINNVMSMQAPAVDLPPVIAEPLSDQSPNKKKTDDGTHTGTE
jgi:hypothetical protein